MDTQKKSLALAKLMNLKVKVFDDSDWKYKRCYVGFSENTTYPTYYKPYSDCVEGLAQFAAILLELPEAVNYFVYNANKPVTQENLLDEILRMHGVME